jgi:ABC-type nitrate/sulfonate/bicarbonate transport system permease component
MQTQPQLQEEELLEQAVARLNARLVGLILGLIMGVGLFLATIVLVIKGGPDPGAHLGLLSQYFPGYSITMIGSFLGFAYGFGVGYVIGALIGAVYNRLAHA